MSIEAPDDSFDNNNNNGSDGILRQDGSRRAAKCCGCCCDYRRATIVLSILGMVAAFLNVILMTGDDEPYMYEDNYKNAYWTNFGMNIVSFLVMGAQLYGAIGYKLWILYASGVSQIVLLPLFIWSGLAMAEQMQPTLNPWADITVVWASNLLGTAFWLYPLVGLIVEIRKGIMSKETYDREKYSCCCTA